MQRREIAMVGAVSAAMIILQICLTRLLAYRLYYHFVFLSITLTMLGMTAGTVFVAVRGKTGGDSFVYRWALLLLALIPVCYLQIMMPLLPSLSNLPVKLTGDAAIMAVGWYSLLSFILNFCGGVILAELFSRAGAAMGRLYAVDLACAGAGCLLGIVLMKYFSPPVAYVSSGLFLFASLWFYHIRTDLSLRARAAGVVVSFLSIAGILWISFGPQWLREYSSEPRKVYKSEWNHLFRTDHIPGMYILDMDAATVTVRWTGAAEGLGVGSPALLVAPREPRVAVIGSGGGLQVADARRARAKSILAVDINPSIVRWVLHEDRKLNGELFVAPGIEVREGEGRHTILSSRRQFDAILIHAIDTYSASAAGAYALTENFLYTREAIRDYLKVLSPDGIVSFSRWMFNPPREDLRLFITCIDALERMKVPDPAAHLIMIAPVADYRQLGSKHVWGHLLLSPTPFTKEKVASLKELMDAAGWSILHAPGIVTESPFSLYAQIPDHQAFFESYPFLVSPVSDRKPYLFQFYNPFSKSSYAKTGDRSLQLIYQPSSLLLPLVFVSACVASFLLVILPLWFRQRRGVISGGLTLRETIYFAAIGIAFMAVEIPLTQTLALYLGHPVYGFVLVLTALLIGSGCGSFLAAKRELNRSRIAGILAILLFALGSLLHGGAEATMQWPQELKFVVSTVALFALGLLLGIPLASGVRLLPPDSPGSVAWAWAVNGAASVVGSTGIMLVMIFLGSHVALITGGAGYLIAAFASRSSSARIARV